MASRNKEDLRLELVHAYNNAFEMYSKLYPNAPQPFLTCTYRSGEEQNELYKKVPKVTNAKAGQSPHNYNPSFAFDIAFITVAKKLSWDSKNFKNFADCVAKVSDVVEWGGSWAKFNDAPHFELKNWKTYLAK